jgi:membrane peptidoglycan carboxypeptidase
MESIESMDESMPPARRRWTRWLPLLRLVGILMLVSCIAVIGTLVTIYVRLRIPPTDQQAMSQAAIIAYSNGEVMARLGSPNRQNVKLDQVPKSVRDAVLAAEDHTFYSNRGVDLKSVARAALSNLRGGSQGGSTISQQYVKNVYNQREKTFGRKFTEVFLAMKINRQIDKDAILERYLNTIYLGRGAFGIQTSSQAYFHRDVGELSVAQGAFLAGIINAPALADPRDGAKERARAERRWGVVLDAMVTEGWLSADVRATLKFPTTVKPARDGVLKGQNGYLVTMAQAEVQRELHLSEAQFRSGGYRIVTTFDQALTSAGVAAVKNVLPKDKPKNLQIGLAAIDPRTGAVRSIYGGRDFLKRQQNAATQDSVEAAGTFSTFTLIAALTSGVGLDNMYNGATPLRVGGNLVHNYRAKQYGYVNLLTATQQSVNTAFAQMNSEIGGRRTRAAALAAGIPASPQVSAAVWNVLGGAGVHPIDLAQAYATLAADGIRREPYVVQSVTKIDDGKELLHRGSAEGTRAFPATAVADATFALQQVVADGTGSYARNLKRPAAGQTGTSASARSAWFVGYTPQLATAVSMYQLSPNGKDLLRMKGFGDFPSVYGGGYPTRIWTNFMTAALTGQPVAYFPPPAFGGRMSKPVPIERDRITAPLNAVPPEASASKVVPSAASESKTEADQARNQAEAKKTKQPSSR